MSQRTLVLAVCVACVLNALWFTATTAIPLPSSDDWSFIDTFVRDALEGHLHLADFFAQRHVGDHAQPLHRLVLLAHLHLAGLDFRLEALIGAVLGIVACGFLAHLLVTTAPDPHQRRRAWLGSAAIFAIGLSLNATMIYTWSLVGLAWLSLLLALLYWRAVPAMRGPRGALAMAASTLALALVVDELAIAAFAAAVGALLVRDRGRPVPALWLLLAGGLGLLAGRWFIHAMSGAASAATSGTLAQVFAFLQRPDAWKLLVVPFADSVVHQQHLVEWAPRAALAMQVAIAAVVLVLHGVFWWRALFSRNRPVEPVLVLAVACMLFFYAAVAGIVLSRVVELGWDYLHQPRYVMLYALNLIALLLMGFGAGAPEREDTRSGVVTTLVGTFAVLLILLQVPVSRAAWREAPYVRQYTTRMATAFAALARNPAVVPAGGCPPVLRVCDAPPATRASIVALMRSHELSLFSASFRSRYGFDDPGLTTAATASAPSPPASLAPSGQCMVSVLKEAPSRVVPGRAFNPQAGGDSAFWLIVPPGTPPFQIEFEGQPVHMNRRGDVVTFLHDARQRSAVDAGRPLHFDFRCAGRPAGGFEVVVER
jgi:hypothetical protein